MDLSASRGRVGELRRTQRLSTMRPYEILYGSRHGSAPRGLRADAIMSTGWARAGSPPLSLNPPVDWEALNESNRSAAFELHAWTPLSPVLVRHSDSGDARYLDFAVAVARDWLRRHPSTDVDSDFAWYDMALGARAYRLGYIADAAARDQRYPDALVAELLDGVVLHARALEDDSRVAWHSNHGFYLAAGQLALARRFPHLRPLDVARDQALGRLGNLLASQFSAEGVHMEHSPGYHLAVLHSLNGLVDAGLLDDPQLDQRTAEIEAALAWFVLPTGTLVTFGDTDWDRSPTASARDFRHPVLRWALSGGEAGTPSTDRVRGFPASGYFVARDWSARDSAAAGDWHLAQTAAFHSRTHKHADDLSFVWFDRGRELLVDPGRYGYLGRTEPDSELARDGFWYSDPGRVYVESTRAHNTVEIDGRNFARVGVRPFGSALSRYGEVDGVLFSESELRHFGTVRHARMLIFNPNRWLVVFDWLHDGAGGSHRYDQRFHFSPEVVAARVKESVAVEVPGESERLFMTALLPAESLELVRGRRDPELLGWVARGEGELMPTWTGGYRREGGPGGAFATLFAFADDPPVAGGSTVTSSGRGFTLRFSVGGRTEELRVTRRTGEPIGIAYGVRGG